jgi:hypothetical protein
VGTTTRRHVRAVLLLGAGVLVALAGGEGGGIQPAGAAPDEAVKKSEDSYNAVIAKQKAAAPRRR